MTISDFQISSVIKTYMRNMKSRAGQAEEKMTPESIPEDKVTISDEGMKRILFERIGEKMTERLRRHEQQE
jgi:hypothetical protein